MIGPVELLALSMGLSIAVSALALVAGAVIEARSNDPVLRDRIWGAALILSLTPVLAAAIVSLTPAPVLEVVTPGLAPAAPAATIQAPPVAASRPGFAPDPGLLALALVGAAGALAALRAAGLAVRSARLAHVLRWAAPADAAIGQQVARVAGRLGVAAPTTLISAQTTEALLCGLCRTRLILPDNLAPESAEAVVAHELAHLKRRDHRMLWLEEAAAVLLAFNPLVPLIRSKRDGAREEACDAIALADASAETRQAYARTLIEALRNRAGSPVPALTFTGARRTNAMRRLKAVTSPAAPAGRRTRLIAGAAGLALLSTIGGATGALALQREPEVRLIASARPQEPRRVDASGHRQLLNGQPLPASLPVWALNPERVDIRSSADGGGVVDFILPFTGTTAVSVNGQRLPDGFPFSGINPEAVADLQRDGEHMKFTLKPEAEVRRQQPADDVAAAQERVDTRVATAARFRRASASDYQRYCASGEPGENGFCMGVMLGHLGRAETIGLCLPDNLRLGGDDEAAVNAYLARGRAEVARQTPRNDEGAYEFSQRALHAAYPCATPRPAPVALRLSLPEPATAPAPAPAALTIAMAAPVAMPALAGLSAAPEATAAPQAAPATAPRSPQAESDFLRRQREARNAARVDTSERGLRLPGWPRPEHPARRAPFSNERRAAQPQ
ncbi:MAG: M56 family metallopeptidase [Brevundimonas sp.]|nr:M56 family metallopeptidase [Brevundimonas sp.]